MFADASDAPTDLMQRVLGEKNEARSRLLDLEAIETGGGTGDGDGDVEAKPRFTALGGTSEEADGLLAPQGADQPGSWAAHLLEIGGL